MTSLVEHELTNRFDEPSGREAFERDLLAAQLTSGLGEVDREPLATVQWTEFRSKRMGLAFKASREREHDGLSHDCAGTSELLDAWVGISDLHCNEIPSRTELALLEMDPPAATQIARTVRSLRRAQAALVDAFDAEDLVKLAHERLLLAEVGADTSTIDATIAAVRAQQASRPALDGLNLTTRLVPWEKVERIELAPIVEQWVPRGVIGLVTALPGVGKSTYLTALGCSVAARTPFLSHIVDPDAGRVLYLPFEDYHGVLGRVDAWCRHTDKVTSDRLIVPDSPGLPLTFRNRAHLRELEAHIVDQGIWLVLIDTFSMAFGLQDENNASEVSAVLRPIVDIAQRTRTTFMFAHHTTKDGSTYRGSTAIAASLDIQHEISKSDDSLLIKGGKWRVGVKPTAIRLEMTSLEGDTGYPVIVRSGALPWVEALVDLLEALGVSDTPVSTGSIVEQTRLRLDWKERTTKEHLRRLLDNGRLDQPKRGYWSLNDVSTGELPS